MSPLFFSWPASLTFTNTVSSTTFSPVCKQTFWYIWKKSSNLLVSFRRTGRTRWIPRCSIAVGIRIFSTEVYGLRRWTRLNKNCSKCNEFNEVTIPLKMTKWEKIWYLWVTEFLLEALPLKLSSPSLINPPSKIPRISKSPSAPDPC